MAEIKSTHSRGISGKFWNGPRKGERYGVKHEGPKLGHRMQLSFYKQYFPLEVGQYTIIYFSREDFYRLEFTMGETDDVKGRTFTEIPVDDFRFEQTIEKYVEQGILPKRTHDVGRDTYPCSWCRYRTRCYGADDGLVGLQVEGGQLGPDQTNAA